MLPGHSTLIHSIALHCIVTYLNDMCFVGALLAALYFIVLLVSS